MLERLLELLVALLVGATGLGVAAEHAGSTPRGGEDALELASETAAVEAAVGFARAEARGLNGRNGEVETESVDGLTEASATLEEVMANAPDEAQPGLQRALEAVTTAPANDRPTTPATGGGPATTGAPIAVPPSDTPVVAAPPVSAPPVDHDAPAAQPPVETPAGPPSDVPGGRP